MDLDNPTASQTPKTNYKFIVGVIGCGSIDSKFVKELIKREIVQSNQILVASRTPSRAESRCGLEVTCDNSKVASLCSILFLFVLPHHFRNFSREIREAIQHNCPLVISSLAGFTARYMQRALNTPFLITTAVDIPTIQLASEHANDECPLEIFAAGEEILHYTDIVMVNLKARFVNENPLFDPFMIHSNDASLQSKLHIAAFAAENLCNSGIEFLNSSIQSLISWLSLDPSYIRIQQKQETFNKLWVRSFFPLSTVTRVESFNPTEDIKNQLSVRYWVKRAFIRSLLQNNLDESKIEEPLEE